MGASRRTNGELVADRYALGEEIGRGGASVVHRAVDSTTGRPVAIKLLDPSGPRIDLRARREIAALRLLRLPGVVTLQDEGTHDGAPFLVMDLVEGRPFPGRGVPAPWEDLALPTLSLLETLSRVHASGVVHRDMKPSNVLVGDDMNVTILDFGVSWGPALGEALTAIGAVVGTPEYLSPEQFTGSRGDPRSDLFAVGVMLYEALTGHLPHSGDNLFELIHLKRSVSPIPIMQVAPTTPPRVAEAVERLLHPDPELRPHSVGDVIQQMFDHDATPQLQTLLPRVGGNADVTRVVESLLAGGSEDVWGHGGTGRTRFLADVGERLATAGRHPRWLPAGTAPYASLLALFEDLDVSDDLSRETMEDALSGEIRSRVSKGLVILADDPEDVDTWSAGVLERARVGGGVVRVVAEPTPGCVTLERLSHEVLRELFAGPDRIFHLCEDGARELHRRTGGLPTRVAAEIGAWVRSGLARWDGRLLVVPRDSLQRLAGGLPTLTSAVGAEQSAHDPPALQDLLAWITLAWPNTEEDMLARVTGRPLWRLQPELEELSQRHRITRLEDGRYQPVAVSLSLRTWPEERHRKAHHTIAMKLPEGAPHRLRHVMNSGEVAEVVAETLRRAERQLDAGHYSDALVTIEQGLNVARRADDANGETRLLFILAEVCMNDGTRGTLQRGLYDIGRALTRSPQMKYVSQLVQAFRDADEADPDEVETVVAGIGRLPHARFEKWRFAVRLRVAMRRGLGAMQAVVDEAETFSEALGDEGFAESIAQWRAIVSRHAGRPLEAARLHEDSAAPESSLPHRASALVNAAMGYIEGGDLESAVRTASQAGELAATARDAHTEAIALALLRGIEYRRESAAAADPELLVAVSEIGDLALEALLAATEAAIAWRAGDLVAARRLARHSYQACIRYGEPGCEIPSRALELVAGATPCPGEIQLLGAAAADIPDPDAAVQAFGLLARVSASQAEARAFRACALERAQDLIYSDAHERRDILSVAEATGVERASGPGARTRQREPTDGDPHSS